MQGSGSKYKISLPGTKVNGSYKGNQKYNSIIKQKQANIPGNFISFYYHENLSKNLQSSKTYKDSCDESCFKVIDSAKTYHQLKVKEALHIL